MTGHFDSYAHEYDRIQPVKIEMYRFYHRLALDILPFLSDQPFRFADLGCGTGNFLQMLLDRFPAATGAAMDLSAEMLKLTASKLQSERVEFIQYDLNDTLPDNLRDLDLAVAFSVFHHLADDRKKSISAEVFNALKPGGWLLIVDAMYVPYSNDVWTRAREREEAARSERMARAGIDPSELDQHEHRKQALDEQSPERDRISTLDTQLENLRSAGFSTVDHAWHLWMEHMVIARR